MVQTIRAAGIAFRAKSGEALFLKRSPTSRDYPGYWCFPGGVIEGEETPEEAAKREAVEEIGSMPKGELKLAARSVSTVPLALPPGDSGSEGAVPVALPGAAPEASFQTVDYSTFIVDVPEQFDVVIDPENIGHAWSPLASPPEPLHPGTRVAIDAMFCDELGIARLISSGSLTSPQVYQNVTLWAMRITGTGVAYRQAKFKHDAKNNVVKDDKGKPIIECEEEFPWRDPAIYLNDEFLARCNGLPVVWKHPAGAKLDSKEFEDRIVGTIFLPFIRGADVWGIAKVYDDRANAALRKGTDAGEDWSTSPGVVISDPNNPSYKFRLEDGSLLLVEGKPSLLDHIAICERGVWDKGGEPAGIINDSQEENDIMVDKTTKTEPTLADVLAAVGSIGERVDAIGARVDAFEKKDSDEEEKAKAKKDAEEKAEKEKADAEMSAEDKAKKDAEDKAKMDADEKAKADAACAEKVAADAKKDAEEAKKDADTAAENAALKKRIAAIEAKLPQDRSDDDHRSMSASQARADSVYELFGKQAPRFLSGEVNGEYRRRLVRELAVHSPSWKSVDVGALPDAAFAVAEEQIFNDAAAAAKDAVGVEDGGLRMVHGKTASGHTKTEFFGRPSAWMSRFSGSRRYATRIQPNTSRREVG